MAFVIKLSVRSFLFLLLRFAGRSIAIKQLLKPGIEIAGHGAPEISS